MDEPTVFLPTSNALPPNGVHAGEAKSRIYSQVHEFDGSLMTRATRDVLLPFQPERRPLVISRPGQARLQRHALHWKDDDLSRWNTYGWASQDRGT